MTEEIDVPIIFLDSDDEDEDDDLKIGKEHKLLCDHLRDDNSLDLLSEDDNGESETRKFLMSSGDSKRSKFGNDKPINNRVSPQRKRKPIGFGDEFSRAVPLVTTRESIQRDNRVAERRKRKIAELEADRVSRAAPSARNQENIQRDIIKARNMSESKVGTLWDVPLFGTQRDKFVEFKVETLMAAPSKEDIQQDNRIAETRKKQIDETKDAGTSRVVHVERVNRVAEVKSVDETSRNVQVTQRNKGVFVGTRKKNEEESVVVVDKDYMSYLTWLVDSHKDLTTEPMADVQNDLPDSDPPIRDTLKESTFVPVKNVLVKVKSELDLECWSDDADIIAVSDSPFLDGQGTPFVASKSVVDLDNEDESRCCLFTKELMTVLKEPYDEGELLELYDQASMKRLVTRCREFRNGRERSYKSHELGKSYFENFTDFDEEYKRVDGDDKARLELLRGFFFYLKNISHDGAFKPWLPENKKSNACKP